MYPRSQVMTAIPLHGISGKSAVSQGPLSLVHTNAHSAPISVVFIIAALLIALHIMYPQSKVWFWKRSARTSRSANLRGDDVEMELV
jgi:hypothetical protein